MSAYPRAMPPTRTDAALSVAGGIIGGAAALLALATLYRKAHQ